MLRRLLVLAGLSLVLASPAAGAGARSWAQPQIKLVTSKGLMGGDAAAFRPNDPLTKGELAGLVAGLSGKDAPIPSDPSTPVTLARLDGRLVRAFGLLPTARTLAARARAAGLSPPGRFGTEAVARLLGLRVNHPTAEDDLERGPDQPATRAEAAYSAARIIGFSAGEVDYVRRLAETFAPPAVSGLRRDVLQTAISLIGYPYVWGGTSESPQDPFGTGKVVPGGFDCSGFVWRVYKLRTYPGAEALAATLKGRSTYTMSGEVGPKKRIARSDIEPGDVLFFGAHGPKSKPNEVDHAGIYLGGDWFIQSSEQGVALASIDSDWYAARFAWARRPLAEAGLS